MILNGSLNQQINLKGEKTMQNVVEINLFDVEEVSFKKKRKRKKKISNQIIQEAITTESLTLFNSNNYTEISEKTKYQKIHENLEEDLNEETDEEFNEEEIDNVTEEEVNSAINGLGNFFKQVNQYKILTKEEEKKYFTEYAKTNDIEIRNYIICCNIKLVISVAKKIAKGTSKVALEDMIGDGVMGLMKAIEKFQPERDLKFSTYAYLWIKQTISRAIANTADVIRIPVHFTENLSKIRRYENESMITNGTDEVSDEETSKALDISVNKIKKYKKAATPVSSLDVPIDENETSILDLTEDEYTPSPEDMLLNNSLHDALMQAINTLEEREAFIIINRFNLNRGQKPLSLQELATHYGVTKERIRQIEASALQKLRHPSKSAIYREYYDE